MIKAFTLITGATSSIGIEIARNRAATDNLLLHGRDNDALLKLSMELSHKTSVKIWCYDFRNIDELNNNFSVMLDNEAIKVNKVVHAAGFLKIMPFRAFKYQDTFDIYNINVFSIIEILRVLTRKKHRVNLNSVVMISAFFSKFGDKGNAIYSSSKGALNSLIKGLAVEFPETCFNSIILGAVRTKMTEHLFDNNKNNDRFNRYILGTGTPDQVSDCVDFLLSENLWMTGQEIFLDGGASIT